VFGALVASYVGGRGAALIIAAFVGIAASAGRLAFDAIVQRDAPDADHGRSFAGFETRFQLAWVAGAFVPVVLHLPIGAGLGVIAIGSGVAAVAYATGHRLEAAPILARLRRAR